MQGSRGTNNIQTHSSVGILARQGGTVLSQETKHALDIAHSALTPALQRSLRRLNLMDAQPGTRSLDGVDEPIKVSPETLQVEPAFHRWVVVQAKE